MSTVIRRSPVLPDKMPKLKRPHSFVYEGNGKTYKLVPSVKGNLHLEIDQEQKPG